jgi:UDP-N-acetylglucosamine--N-acetylmuramyl-(pentapeptide) pyrophosphoryl-undecaprenol N-acetylglucosamine transferase
MSYLIAAGGSGGHLFPALGLAKRLKTVHFAGHGLARSPFFDRSFPYTEIDAAPRSFLPLVKGWIQSIRLLRTLRPKQVIGFGSYHTFPVLAAAVCLKIPLVLYAPDRRLGLVNRLFAPLAKTIAGQHPLSPPHKKEKRLALYPWDKKEVARKDARERYGLSEGKTVLIFGGSQGARFLNRAIPPLLPSFLRVIHITGKGEEKEEVQALYQKKNQEAVVLSFEPEMVYAYRAADVAICRAGAATIGELISYELPALLIPYPHAYNHQEANARYLADELGGGRWIRQGAPILSPFTALLEELEERKKRLRSAQEGRLDWEEIL